VKRNDKDNTKISLGLNVKIISTATTYRPTGPYRYLKIRFSPRSITSQSCYIIWMTK